MKAPAILLSLIFFVELLSAQTDDVRKKNYNIKKGIAIEGYDPVSYFNNKPAEGKSSLSLSCRGVTYFFSSAANQTKFKANPEK